MPTFLPDAVAGASTSEGCRTPDFRQFSFALDDGVTICMFRPGLSCCAAGLSTANKSLYLFCTLYEQRLAKCEQAVGTSNWSAPSRDSVLGMANLLDAVELKLITHSELNMAFTLPC